MTQMKKEVFLLKDKNSDLVILNQKQVGEIENLEEKMKNLVGEIEQLRV